MTCDVTVFDTQAPLEPQLEPQFGAESDKHNSTHNTSLENMSKTMKTIIYKISYIYMKCRVHNIRYPSENITLFIHCSNLTQITTVQKHTWSRTESSSLPLCMPYCARRPQPPLPAWQREAATLFSPFEIISNQSLGYQSHTTPAS